MKTRIIVFSAVLWITSIQAQHSPQAPGVKSAEDPPTSVSIRQNDFDLCTNQFYVDVYELTVAVFAQGAAQVQLDDYTAKMFALVRSSDEFAGGGAEAFIDHIKDIPGQLLQIITEDPTVLDSCANFSIALVGPP